VTLRTERERTLARCVRGCALFDLLVTACLAFPPSARLFVELLFSGDAALGLGSPRVGFQPLHWLFVHLAGALGVLWALARLRAPTAELALFDVGGRLAVAALILHATAAEGMTPLLHLFVATELAGAALQYVAVRRVRPEPTD
jgi:hypothetical protein